MVAGALLTTAAVVLAARLMRRGDKIRTQVYFRYRVAAQLLTLVALVAGGLFIASESDLQRAERQDELRAKAKQREALWVQELERRDAEIQARKRRIERSNAELRDIARLGFQDQRAKLRQSASQDASAVDRSDTHSDLNGSSLLHDSQSLRDR